MLSFIFVIVYGIFEWRFVTVCLYIEIQVIVRFVDIGRIINGVRVAQRDIAAHASLSTIRRGFAPCFVDYKKGALDSQPHVIKLTSCLPKVGGSPGTPASSTTKTGRHDIAGILLKVALNAKKIKFKFKFELLTFTV